MFCKDLYNLLYIESIVVVKRQICTNHKSWMKRWSLSMEIGCQTKSEIANRMINVAEVYETIHSRRYSPTCICHSRLSCHSRGNGNLYRYRFPIGSGTTSGFWVGARNDVVFLHPLFSILHYYLPSFYYLSSSTIHHLPSTTPAGRCFNIYEKLIAELE